MKIHKKKSDVKLLALQEQEYEMYGKSLKQAARKSTWETCKDARTNLRNVASLRNYVFVARNEKVHLIATCSSCWMYRKVLILGKLQYIQQGK